MSAEKHASSAAITETLSPPGFMVTGHSKAPVSLAESSESSTPYRYPQKDLRDGGVKGRSKKLSLSSLDGILQAFDIALIKVMMLSTRRWA